MDEKKRDGDEVENNVEDSERICESRGMACLIGLGRPRIGVSTRWIRISTCDIRDGHLTCTLNSPKSQVRMMISPVHSYLSHSCPPFYHHLRTRS